MVFTQYASAAAFADDVLEVIKAHEIQNNLIYRNIGDGNVMLTVKDDSGRVLLVASQTPPHPMVMYERGNLHNEQAVCFFAEKLKEHGIDLNFLMADDELAQSLIRCYGDITGKHFESRERLTLSVTDHAQKPERLARGGMRLATEDDLHYLPYWGADFSVTCAIGPYNLQSGLDNALRLIADKSLYVWEDGTPVSMAASHRKVTGCRFIGYVYTPPQFRGHGYGTACVYTLTRQLLTEQYPRCALYIDCANPISNRIYEKIGYRRTGYIEQYQAVQA